MLLNGDQIRQKNLIQNGTAASYRYASYDLQIGQIIDHAGKIVESIGIPPQGMVRVISRERLLLPGDTVGNATVKTSLCDDGILAINIGIIDPGYEGLASSTLINFGKSAFHIQVGDSFLRVTFHEITPTVDAVVKSGKPDKEYVREKTNLVLRLFSDTFLNVEQTATEAAHRVVGSFWPKLIVWASIFALVFTAGTSLATTFSAMRATDTYIQSDQLKLKSDMSDLQNEIKNVEAELAKQNPQQPTPSPSKHP